jgi:hypothetical protein
MSQKTKRPKVTEKKTQKISGSVSPQQWITYSLRAFFLKVGRGAGGGTTSHSILQASGAQVLVLLWPCQILARACISIHYAHKIIMLAVTVMNSNDLHRRHYSGHHGPRLVNFLIQSSETQRLSNSSKPSPARKLCPNPRSSWPGPWDKGCIFKSAELGKGCDNPALEAWRSQKDCHFQWDPMHRETPASSNQRGKGGVTPVQTLERKA